MTDQGMPASVVGRAGADQRPCAGDGRLRADIANSLVRLYKEHYGRGPTMARAFIQERYVFCVLEEGLTRNEQTLIDGGQHDLVATYRARFNAVVEPILREAMEELTGRRVVCHHSQLVLDPARTFEVFELDAPLADADAQRAA